MANEKSSKIRFMPMLWVKVCGFARNISIGFVCGVLLLSILFTPLPFGIFSDLNYVGWMWGCPWYFYEFGHASDGDYHYITWHGLIFDVPFWLGYFSLLGFVAGMIWRKIGLRIRPFYSLCIIGCFTGTLYVGLFHSLINVETYGYISCFESRTERIEQALRFRDVETARTLLKNHPDLVFTKDATGTPLLFYAAYYGQYEIVKLMLADKADVNAKGRINETPLFGSAMNGYLGVTKLLLQNGAEVNIKDDNGDTPLLRSVLSGRSSVVKLLLANNANVNARNSDGSTPLDIAAGRGYRGTVQLLIDNDAEINATNQQGESPLYAAIFSGHKDVVELLLTNNADVNARDFQDETPLHAAVKNEQEDIDIVALLLANKADVNATSKYAGTPLQVASEHGYTNIVKLLRQHGAH